RGADRAARRLRGGNAVALDAGAPQVQAGRRRHRRRPRTGRAALLRGVAAARGGKPAAAGCFFSAGAAVTAACAAICDAGPARAAVRLGHHRAVPGAGRPAMSVAIVDYGSGNLHSAAKAFERAARESKHSQPIKVTSDPDVVRHADRVVLPGVGAFADCRHGLEAIPGMVDALEEAVRTKGRPFFGICVGMQLMAERGREYTVTPGLGWIAGEVDKIVP